MVSRTQRGVRGRRRGGTLVETAFVLVLFTTFVFGVFEYSRMVMDWELLNNAAREGCRYALANNTSATIAADVKTTVTSYLGPEAASFTGLAVTVTGTHNGASTAVNSLVAGDTITVTVSGTYNFMNIVPLVKMPTSFTMTGSVTMGCEGAT